MSTQFTSHCTRSKLAFSLSTGLQTVTKYTCTKRKKNTDQPLGFQYTLHTSLHVIKSETHHRTLYSGPTIFTSIKPRFQKPLKTWKHLNSWRILHLSTQPKKQQKHC